MKQELFIKEINMLNDMLEKNNKKDKNLISNLIKDIYESLINDLSKD